VKFNGGFGISPFGQSEMGHPKSDIKPTFLQSKPLDASIDVPTNVWLRFDTYLFSSWIDIEDITVEISEDNGATYNLAFDGTVFAAPYDGLNSKVRRPESHIIRFWIDKAGLWPPEETVKIRFTGVDEFGNVSVKEAPVVWS
jgi:hypothetical protein